MKKAIILLFFTFFLSHISFSQVTQRNILATKYTKEYVKENLIGKKNFQPYPTTPDAWQQKVSKQVIEKLIADGTSALAYKFEPISATISLDFVRSGDRERHSNISFAKRNKLMQLIIAESMEDKGRFTEAILNGIWSICEESYWGVPAHIGGTGLPDVENPVVDLFTAETASVIAMADYFVGAKMDKINPLIRKRMYHETDVRLFQPMLKNGSKYGWMSRTKPVNNWNPWIMSNWILSTLLLEKDEAKRAEMTYGAMYGLDAYLNGLGDDGGCDEGPSYWFAAGASVFDCLELLDHATAGKVNIYDQVLIKKMAGYIINTHISGNYFVNFADADPTLIPNGTMLYRFGQAVKDDQLMSFGKWAAKTFNDKGVGGFMRMRQMEDLLTISQLNLDQAELNPVKAAWISDVQIMTARTEKGLFLGTHGGHNAESHNHNDVGDFIVYLDGQPMIVDAGRGNYTARTFSSHRYELWFTQSQYHNLPIVNGIGQKAGREFEAKQVSNVSDDKQSTLNMDIAAAYPKEAGIMQWNRKVSINRIKEQVDIQDNYVLTAKPSSLEQVFMTITDVDLATPGSIVLKGDAGKQLVIKYDAKAWTVSTDIPSSEGMEYNAFKTKWGGKKVTRITLNRTALSAQGKSNFTIMPIR